MFLSEGKSLIEYGLEEGILSSDQVRKIEKHQLKYYVTKGLITAEQAKELEASLRESKGASGRAKQAAVSATRMSLWEDDMPVKAVKNERAGGKKATERGVMSTIHKIAYFAVGCVVLGIISLIAANWNEIPDAVKLVCGFGTLFGTLAGVVRYMGTPQKKLFELMIFASLGLILANIGLVGQIFHLNGSFDGALWLWIVLSTPLFWISKKEEMNTVWWVLLFIFSAMNYQNPWTLPVILASFPLLVKNSFLQVKTAYWFVLAFHLCESQLLTDFWKMVRMHMDLVSMFFSLMALFYLIYRGLSKLEKPDLAESFGIFFKIFGIGGIVMMDFWHSTKARGHNSLATFKGIAAINSVIAIALITIIEGFKPWIIKSTSPWFIGIFLGILAFTSTMFPHPLWGACFTVLGLISLAIWAARVRYLNTVNLLVGLMFLRIVILYFHLFVSLLSLGASLVGFGVIVLLAIGFWLEFKDRLISLMQRNV